MRSKKPFSVGKPTFVIFITLLLGSAIVPTQAQARKFRVLHTFHGKDGANPVGVLIRDTAGNLYGTTGVGGGGSCSGGGGEGCGTVFKLNKTGTEVWLHKFGNAGGAIPYAGVWRDSRGNLFGTTIEGGDIGGCDPSYGCGVVFELNETGTKERALHKFTGGADGLMPEALLVEDKAGNLYGTAPLGGRYGLGVVFKVAPNGRETILYNFAGGSDGCGPNPGVILDSAGNLYGVASGGGDSSCNSGHGVVFEVDPGGHETVLYTFGGGDGAIPNSVLLFDSMGNLYGTTEYGGSSSECGGLGCGTVFELSPRSGGGWSESVLYNFCSLPNCTDGERPVTGPLVRDSAGSLYGTTIFGGNPKLCNGSCGVVFKLESNGKETVLHTFTGGSDGAVPFAGLVADDQGNLYGTTQEGGAACYGSYTCGVVFKISP